MNGIVWNGNVNEEFFAKNKKSLSHTVKCVVNFDSPYSGNHSVDFQVKKNDDGRAAARNLVKKWNAKYKTDGPFAFCVEAAVLFVGGVNTIRVNNKGVDNRRRAVPNVSGLKMARVWYP